MKAPKVKRVKALLHLGGFYKGAWFILPADAESYERMVEQMGNAGAKAETGSDLTGPLYFALFRVGLRAIGITPPKKGRK